jgi:hypothetical protein
MIEKKSNIGNLVYTIKGIKIRRGLAWGLIILAALLAFEVFNFSTTEFALKDVLGNLSFAGMNWSMILAIAFCGIDFAGIARLFTPEKGKDEPAEVWYLFGAWLLAASMNAMLTWWGISVAIAANGNLLGTQVVAKSTLLHVVPVFVAVMVWLIRVLIIGTFSVSGERLFSQGDERPGFRPARFYPSAARPAVMQPVQLRQAREVAPAYQASTKPARAIMGYPRAEPAYQNISMDTKSNHRGPQVGTRQ